MHINWKKFCSLILNKSTNKKRARIRGENPSVLALFFLSVDMFSLCCAPKKLGFSLAPVFFFMLPCAVLLGIGAGAIDAGLISERIKTRARVFIGTMLLAIGVFVILLPLPPLGAVSALAIIGFGNGSIYPNLMHLTPHNFGREASASVMGSLIAFAYIGVMLAPPIVGIVTRSFGMASYPFILAALLAVTAASLAVFVHTLKKHNRFFKDV